MQPEKCFVPDLFDKRLQYMIPLFQRGYVWSLADHVLPLWGDLMAQVKAISDFKEAQEKVRQQEVKPPRKHFMGTLVLGPLEEGGQGQVDSREVIDGQQRITTFQLLYLAFRDVMKEVGDEAVSHDLKQLTWNVGDYRDKSDHHKVNPTNVGRDIMRGLVDQGGLEAVCKRFPVLGAGRKAERPAMVQAYLFFYGTISLFLRGKDHDDVPSGQGVDGKDFAHLLMSSIHRDTVPQVFLRHLPILEGRAQRLLSALRSSFQLMLLKLDDQEDDPQIIFETLNARGVPLQPSDLIRNYLFLKAARKKLQVDDLYERYWKHYDETPEVAHPNKELKFWKVEEKQGRLKSSRLDLFLYHYLRLRRQEEIKVTHVFEEFKTWWEDEDRDMETELARLQTAAEHFKTFITPGQSSRLDIFCRRIRMLETATIVPLVLYFLEHHEPASDALNTVLNDLESYLVRRFICGLTPKGYNQLFTRLLRDLSRAGSADPAHLRRMLQELNTNSYLWPGETDFHREWLNRPIYAKGGMKARAVLEGLEGAYASGKQEWRALPEALSVEHVMPQKWQNHWPLVPDTEDAFANRNRVLHTIGNLTLVMAGFNASLSNEAFKVKRREITMNSLLRLNTYFQDLTDEDSWDEARIQARGEALFDTAKRLWSHPGPLPGESHVPALAEEEEDEVVLVKTAMRRTQSLANGIKPAWNGEFYAAFGEGDHRLWSDARRLGFFSAGGGRWYSRTLSALSPGDRLWVHVPGRGYVATGIVESRVTKVDAFRVRLPDGRDVPISDPAAGIVATGMFQYQADPDKAEYLVGVRWLRAFDLSEAIWEPDFFALEHSVCRPRVKSWGRTVARLKEIWEVE